MNSSFKIRLPVSQSVDTSDCILLMEVSQDYLSYGIFNPAEQQFMALEYFRLDSDDNLNTFKTILINNEWFSKSYNHVKVTYNFPDSLITPVELFDKTVAQQSLSLIYGDVNAGEMSAEYIPNWDVYNVYRVPVSFAETVDGQFVQPQKTHLNSVFLKNLAVQTHSYNENIFAVFFEQKLMVAVIKENSLLLIQSYDYETAEDVNYLLLNIVSRFDLNCESVNIVISGLLDDQSSMYNEMRKYFQNVMLDKRPSSLKYTKAFEEYPPHFFNTLYWSALCE